MKIDTKSAVIGAGVITGIALVGKGIHMFFTRKKDENPADKKAKSNRKPEAKPEAKPEVVAENQSA